MDEKVKFELDAGHRGWRCSGCGLRVDCIGRPLFGKEIWNISSNSVTWIVNKPMWNFCPQCGKAVQKHA